MSGKRKKVYQKGDTVNFRLSKRRIKDRVVDAINEANQNDELNEFIMDALDFYVKQKNKALLSSFIDDFTPLDRPIGNVIKLNDIDNKIKEPIRENSINEISNIKKYEDDEDEIFGQAIESDENNDEIESEIFERASSDENSKGLRNALRVTRRY